MAEVAAASVAIDSVRPQQSTALPRSAAPMSWLSGLNLSFQLSPNRYTFPLLSRQSMFQQAFFGFTDHCGCLTLQTWKYGPSFRLRWSQFLCAPGRPASKFSYSSRILDTSRENRIG